MKTRFSFKMILFVVFGLLLLPTSLLLATTIVCDTTSSLTIPGAQNAYSMNFNCAVPSTATATLDINWTAVGDRDGRDYFRCGGNTLFTTSALTDPLPKLTTTDVTTCLRGYNLSTGNRICTANAWNTNCGGYYYGLAAGHSTMSYARLTVTYADGAPNVLTLTPTDGNTTVNMANDLVIYFDRTVYVGSGNIVIKKGADNSIVETIAVTSGQVTGNGSPTITINPSSDLIKNTAYYVQIDATAFNDGSGNNYAGISNTTSWNFTTLNIALPTTQASNLVFSNVASTSLTLGWTNGNGNGRMVFAKQSNAGSSLPLEYTNYTANASFGSGSQIGDSGWYAIYSGTGSSVNVTNLSFETNYIFHVVEYNTTSGAKVYLTSTNTNNPSVAYITSTVYNTTSFLTIPGAQNPYSMNFNTTVPTGATALLNINWTAVGDRDGRDYFRCGGSTIYTTSAITAPLPKLMSTDVSTCVRGYDLSTGNRICTANAWNTNCGGYYYGLAAGHSTMEYARLTVTYSQSSPIVTTFSPTDNSTTASTTGNLIINFDRTVNVGSGNIIIKRGLDNSIVETIDVTSGQVTGSGTSVITIDPSVTLDGGTTYYIQINSGSFVDTSSNSFTGITDTTTWNFTTVDITNPTITSISSNKANGAYKADEVIDIDVTFSEAVTSTGEITVTLETGDTDRTCTFTVTNSATGTCDYTVQTGDNSSDLTISSISGTIADQSSNSMTDFIPVTNLATNKALIIDTTAPETPIVSPAGGTYTAIQSVALSSSGSNAIYYTTNGDTPTTSSTQYDSLISIDSSQTIKAVAIDTAGNESAILSATYEINLDPDAPILSNIDALTSSSRAIITWNTDENASALINYGLTSDCTATTSESDISPRDASHSVTLSSLVSCTRYYYKAQSTDSNNNIGYSSVGTFKTTGCTGDSTITATGQTTASSTSGGMVTRDNIIVNIPTAFKNSVDSAVFQAHKIDNATFITQAGTPTGLNQVGTDVYTLRALTDENTNITSFDNPITITMNYSDDDIIDLDESTLWIYRYDGNDWYALSGCAVDQDANTVTCNTTAFSDFGLFGEEEEESEPEPETSTDKLTGTTVEGQVKNLLTMNKKQEAEILVKQYPNLFPSLVATTTLSIASTTMSACELVELLIKMEIIILTQIPTAKSSVCSINQNNLEIIFTHDLQIGDEGESVKELQKFLIQQNKGPIAKELARVGVTGSFGIYTKNALGEFQKAVNIKPWSGYFGSITRDYINNFLK